MRPLAIPEAIRAALEDGAVLAISMSGGKDSLAMATALVEQVDRESWPGEVYAIHSDLGRMEWGGYENEEHWLSTLGHVRSQAQRLGLPLVVVRREDRDLLGHIQARRERLADQGRAIPFWPSAASRYCTSDMKRAVIDKYLRRHDFVVCAMGIRRDESARRAKSMPCDIRQRITSTAKCYQGIEVLALRLCFLHPVIPLSPRHATLRISGSGRRRTLRGSSHRRVLCGMRTDANGQPSGNTYPIPMWLRREVGRIR